MKASTPGTIFRGGSILRHLRGTIAEPTTKPTPQDPASGKTFDGVPQHGRIFELYKDLRTAFYRQQLDSPATA
jgi:hypothetical protein